MAGDDSEPKSIERRFEAAAAERDRAENNFRAVVEGAPNGLVMVDERGRIVLVNRAAEVLFGYSRDQLIGKLVEILVPEADRPGHPSYRRQYIGAPKARPMGQGRDLMGRRKNGTTFPVEIGLSPLATATGMRTLATIIDISERKKVEAALAGALERQKLLMRELNHRVTNGFQIMSSILRLQRRPVQDKVAAHALDAAVERLNSMAVIHRRLYMNENSVGTQNAAAYLEALCDDLRKVLFTDSAVCLVFEGAGGAEIQNDKIIPIGLIANELVMNAFKYAYGPGKRGRIVLRWEDLPSGHRLTVEDAGAGLAEHFNAKNSSGLGMMIVFSQIAQLGGELMIDRTPPGVRFMATFPQLE